MRVPSLVVSTFVLVIGCTAAVCAAENAAPTVRPVAPVTAVAAPEPVRVVSATPANPALPAGCQNAVWPNVPPECVKGKDGAAPVRPVRVVGAQDDLRTNPAAAREVEKPAAKPRRQPSRP